MNAPLVSGGANSVVARPVTLQDLLGKFPSSQFLAEYLHRLPLALSSAGRPISHLGTWLTVESLVTTSSADVMIVRSGQLYPRERPVDVATVKELSENGYTIVIRHAELHLSQIANLAKIFSNTFRAAVDVQVFATPPDSFGFSWHYDAEDVFIFQCAGEKEYWLRKNTVNPWPLEETLPKDMRYERETMPLLRVVLQPGDLLYIPCGYWHKAKTTRCAGIAISLAVGVMSRSAADIINLLRNELLKSLVWRQRLPVTNDSEPNDSARVRETTQHILGQLAADLSSTLNSSKFFERIIEEFRL